MTNNQAQAGSFSFQEKNKKLRKKALREQRSGKLIEAKALYQSLIQRDPTDGQSYYSLGKLLKEMNQPVEAAAYLEKAITLGIKSSDVFSDLADTFINISRFKDATAMARAAITLNPDNIEGLRSLVLGLFAEGHYEQALSYGEKLVSKLPNSAEDYVLLAKITAGSNHYDAAIKFANKALSLDPNVKNAHQVLCATYTSIHRWDEAMEIAETALKIEPGNPTFNIMKATLLERQGEYKEAYELTKPLIKYNQKLNSGAIHLYAKIAKHFNEQDEALKLLKQLQSVDQLPVSILNTTSNLLGTAYDELEQYDDAFAAFEIANKVKPHRYNEQEYEEQARKIMGWFTKEHFQQAPVPTHNSSRPIFIVGMPRSGTSLTEKILARHPDVFGGGELKHMEFIVKNKLPEILSTNKIFPDYLQDMSTADVDLASQFYLDHINQLGQNNEAHVTDKMPMNFLYLGLIAILFPKARIINCSRDPLDVGLSCYFVNFTNIDHMGFTQDLRTIGNYYVRYEKLMTHWHAVLAQPIYNLSYEALVSTPETEIRKLLEFCELPWHEECLTPHKSEDAGMTASYNQIRKPIYTKSIGRWENYEQHLQPLKDALGLT